MTDEEKQQAERDARRRAAELALLLLTLLNAKNREGLEAQVRFDAAKGRFYFKGKSVAVRQIRNYLLRIEGRQAKHLAEITEQLADGKLTTDEWKREFDRTIRSTHILAGALAVGGIAAAVRNDRIVAVLTTELDFADKFAKDIRKKAAGSRGRMIARARSYARAARRTFVNAELEGRKALGLQTEARNRLTAAESCHTSADVIGCVELTAKQWIPIEEMVRIGDRSCKPYCKCWIEYR